MDNEKYEVTMPLFTHFDQPDWNNRIYNKKAMQVAIDKLRKEDGTLEVPLLETCQPETIDDIINIPVDKIIGKVAELNLDEGTGIVCLKSKEIADRIKDQYLATAILGFNKQIYANNLWFVDTQKLLYLYPLEIDDDNNTTPHSDSVVSLSISLPLTKMGEDGKLAREALDNYFVDGHYSTTFPIYLYNYDDINIDLNKCVGCMVDIDLENEIATVYITNKDLYIEGLKESYDYTEILVNRRGKDNPIIIDFIFCKKEEE